MAYALQSAIHVSLDNSTWYKLTDHNRKEVQVTPELIESSSRMANGKLRKYVVAQKYKISTSWSFVPSKTALTVDGNYGAAWLESFYQSNVGIPMYVKVISSEIDPDASIGGIPSDSNYKGSSTGFKVYNVFISDFNSTTIKRTPDRGLVKGSDYVDMNIEFTEI
jgi:hypothetical protein